jgi:hypothetical protein
MAFIEVAPDGRSMRTMRDVRSPRNGDPRDIRGHIVIVRSRNDNRN